MTSGQISYDLRRLRAHQIIERIPHSRTYQVTEEGLTIALFLTRAAQQLLIPGLAQLTSPGPPGRSRLRQADRAYRDALTDLARQASLTALRHLQLSPAEITSLSSAVTQPQLDSKFNIPAGKDNLPQNSSPGTPADSPTRRTRPAGSAWPPPAPSGKQGRSRAAAGYGR